jgi:hypothetical protein
MGQEIGQRISKKDLRSKVSGFILQDGLVGSGKAPKLEFYNDEEDKVERPPMPPKPRYGDLQTKTEEEWHRRLVEWEALKPYDVKVMVKGNAMTQKYYVERLLPPMSLLLSMREIDDKPWLL